MPPFADTSGSHHSPSRPSHSHYYQPPQATPRPVLRQGAARLPAQHDLSEPVRRGAAPPKPMRRIREQSSVPLHPSGKVNQVAPGAIASGKKSGGYVVAGGSIMLALMAILLPNPDKSSSAKSEMCQQEVQAQSVLSRDELSKLLSVPERSTKQAVRDVIAEPFCLMAPVSVREGAPSEREAYPLEFDPQTWLIVLYEGDEYAGYDFSFRQ